MMPNLRASLILLFASGAASARARAQSVTYLLPDRYDVVAGRDVSVHVSRGTSGALETIPWPSVDVGWFLVRSAGTQRNLADADARPALENEDFVRLSLSDPDAALIGIDARPRIERIPGSAWQKFLEAEIADSALPADWRRRASGETVRVRRVESMKLLVRAAKTGSSDADLWRGSATGSSKTGQRTEIRPLIDPTAMAVGSDLPLRVSWADPTGVEAKFVVRQVAAETVQRVSAPGGAGWFTVTAPGEWRIEVHRAKPLQGDPAADWELETATLSFVVPAPSKPAGGGK